MYETSWIEARLAYHGVEPRERDDARDAARLARRINARLSNLLSRDAKVTAMALKLYDPKLPGLLIKEWSITAAAADDDDEEGEESNVAESNPAETL